MVIDDTGSVEDIHAFIYCAKWRSGQVSRMPHSLTDSQRKDRATQLLIKYKSGALVMQCSKHQVCECPIYGRIMWKCLTQLEVIEQVLRVGQKVKQLPAQAQRAKKAEEGQKSSEGEQKEIKETQFFAWLLLS